MGVNHKLRKTRSSAEAIRALSFDGAVQVSDIWFSFLVSDNWELYVHPCLLILASFRPPTNEQPEIQRS